jgi:hypothetical protein
LLKEGTGVDATKIMIYHHAVGEDVSVPKNGVVPKQGETFRWPFKDGTAGF